MARLKTLHLISGQSGYFYSTASKGNKHLTSRKNFSSLNGRQTKAHSLHAPTKHQCHFSSSQILSPRRAFCHSISQFTIALNKVKEAVRLPSSNKWQREKTKSTDKRDCAPCRLPPLPEVPPQALRWRHLRRRPGDSWGWWRRWWILPAPQSQPLWCWYRSPRVAAIWSTASCLVGPWEETNTNTDGVGGVTIDAGRGGRRAFCDSGSVTRNVCEPDTSCERDTQDSAAAADASPSSLVSGEGSAGSPDGKTNGRDFEGCLHQSHQTPGGNSW